MIKGKVMESKSKGSSIILANIITPRNHRLILALSALVLLLWPGVKAFAQESSALFYEARNKANVRENGTMAAKVISQVNKGDRLEFIEENNNWFKLKLPDGSVGWIYKNLLKPIQWGTEANIFYGNLLFYRGDLDEAIKQYRLAITSNPDNWRARYNLANAYLKREMIGEAIEEYEQLNQRWPDNFDSYYNLGLAYYKQSNWNKAVEAWERAATLNPNSVKVYYNLAWTLERLDKTEAIKNWKKYLDQAALYPEAIKNTKEIAERIKTLSENTN